MKAARKICTKATGFSLIDRPAREPTCARIGAARANLWGRLQATELSRERLLLGCRWAWPGPARVCAGAATELPLPPLSRARPD